MLDAFKDFQFICSFLDSFMVIGLKSNLERKTGVTMNTVVHSEGGKLLQNQGWHVCDLTCVCLLLVFSPADLVSLGALTTYRDLTRLCRTAHKGDHAALCLLRT